MDIVSPWRPTTTVDRAALPFVDAICGAFGDRWRIDEDQTDFAVVLSGHRGDPEDYGDDMLGDLVSDNETPAAHVNAIFMLCSTQQAHYLLSQMADQKASFLLGAASVMFTICIGQLHPGGYAPFPFMVLGGFAFLTAVLAVLVILPSSKLTHRGEVNLLFFGSFLRFDQHRYLDEIQAAIRTDEMIYRTMSIDIYQHGAALAQRKYRLLAYAYRLFLLGLTVSLVAYLATALPSFR